MYSDLEFRPVSKGCSSFQPYDHHPRTRLIQNSIDDKIVLEKFQYDTSVKLETGERKNIQHLTTNDFLSSANQSQQYSR
jgi:hypothetical protein